MLSDIGMTKDVQTFCISCHDSVFDAIVNHLDEVASPVWPAVEVALLGRSSNFLTTGSARCRVNAGGQNGEDRVKMLHHSFLTADHQAVTTLQAPDSSTRSNVNIMNTPGFELGSAPDIIVIVGIATVDDDVSGSE